MLLHELVDRRAQLRPDDLAVGFGDTSLTYQQFATRIHSMARVLRQAHPAGTCLGVVSANSIHMLTFMYAAPAAGLVVLLINTRLSAAERTVVIEDGHAAIVYDAHDLERLGSEAVELDDLDGDEFAGQIRETDTAWIIHTSGTTGIPKGACLTHRSLLAAVRATAAGRPFRPDDVYLFVFPLFHVAAYNVLHAHARGLPVILADRFEPASAAAAIETFNVTSISLAPTMLAMLLDDPTIRRSSLRSLRSIAYGASAMPVGLLRRGVNELNCRFAQGYGMTEMSGNGCFLGEAEHELALGSQPELLGAAGKPAPGCEMSIRDDDGNRLCAGEVGEIWVRGEQVISGYVGRDDLNASEWTDGWFHTGDLGRFDGEGYLYIVDRMKDIVITGGENVSSREVEDVLSLHPEVAMVAVIATPDATWGEAVTAVVVPTGPQPDTDSYVENLRNFVRGHLSGFKCPKRYVLANDLPLGASGKVQKNVLRQQLRDGV